MAINIFQGSSNKASKSVNSARATTRAQQAKAALAQPAQVSSSGSTAVGSNGTLQKIGKFVGETAGIVSKFAPGIAGTVAKGLNNLLNDPEWWQSVPGDACTLNTPLRMVRGRQHNTTATGSPDNIVSDQQHTMFRPAIAEFVSGDPADAALFPGLQSPTVYAVINPSETAVTQYLMPEIRKVVNAIPLQTAAAYKQVLQVDATAYALWRNLKRYKYMVDTGHTYLPNMNTGIFPILSVENAEKLSAYINRLEEYLRSHVRLPHTLCEYLSWRFGRVYKSCKSAKAGLILYNVLPMDTNITSSDPNEVTYESYIGGLLKINSAAPNTQQAETDMYNAYYDHDLWVEIKDDTQFMYDAKEFCLRTNLDVIPKMDYKDTHTISGVDYFWQPVTNDNPNPVFIDSDLDIPTAFMASTVSTLGVQGDEYSLLFPVNQLAAYVASPGPEGFKYILSEGISGSYAITDIVDFSADNTWGKMVFKKTDDLASYANAYRDDLLQGAAGPGPVLYDLLICKPLDIYNKDVRLPLVPTVGGLPQLKYEASVDMTSLSMDTAMVTDETLAVEHVYAFANLVNVGRKTSTGYSAAEKMVARDTANLVEKLDIAQAKS